MNYWRRWIARIQKKTGHLSPAEMGCYDRLLDWCYGEEKPLPPDLTRCCRIAGAVTPDEIEAVRSVLQQFFVLSPTGYSQNTVSEELAIAQPAIDAARANGAKGGRPKGSGKKPSEKPSRKPSGLPQRNPAETQPAPQRGTHRGTTDQPLTLLPSVESKKGEEGAAVASPLPPPAADATVHPSHPAPDKPAPVLKPAKKAKPETGAQFMRFWDAWPKHPRKAARLQCWNKWRADGLDERADEIVAHVEAMKRSPAWLKDGGDYIVAPLVYLNQARYEAPVTAELDGQSRETVQQYHARLAAEREAEAKRMEGARGPSPEVAKKIAELVGKVRT